MRILSTLLCIALLFSFGLLEAQVPEYLPKDGLIGWWPFNGNANDESGNGNHGVVNGPTPSNDRFGKTAKSYSFDGVDDFVETDTSLLVGKKYFTYSFWAKTSSKKSMEVLSQGDFNAIINWHYCGGSPLIGPQGLSFKSGNHWATADTTTADDSWHMYTIVSGTNGYEFGRMKLFIDGKLQGLTCGHNWGSWTYSFPDVRFTIGKRVHSNYFNGQLDDIAVWNRPLDSNEVSNLFKNSKVQNVTIDSFSRAKITKAVNLGGNGKDNGLVVCEDYDKNILITGNYINSIDVFPGDSILLLNSVGLQNSYLLKIDSNFNYIHSIPIQGDLITCTRNVTVDKYNNYYIGGFFRRSITFKFPTKDTILRTPDNYSDVFIAKYNPNGILQWVRQLKSDSDDDVSGMKVSDDGVLFTTGYCGGTIDLNPSNGQDIFTTKGVDDAYVVKLNSEGEYISGFILGSTGNTYGNYILPDFDNQFYLSGSFSQSMQLVNQKNQVISLSSKGELDGFLIKYDISNKAVWTKTLGGSRNDGIGQCSFDKEQNLVFASSFSDSINLKFNSNQISVKSKGDQDILLAKCDSAGNITWYSTIGSPKKDNLFHFSIDNNNFLHSYSKVNDSLIVSDSIIFLNTNDYYSLITYDSSGRMKKGYSIADFYGNWETPENGEYGYVFYPTRHSGELIASGFYTDSVRFYNESDSITLKSNGSTDAFVARLIIPKEIQLNCTYSIKESDTTICPGNSVELNAIQTSSIKSEIPKNGLIGYWPFNGNANDESGNRNHGNVDGAILTIDRCGKSNQAYSFDGLSNKITIEDNPLLRPTSLTCAAWIYLEDDINLNQILAKNAGSGPFESIDMVIGNENGFNLLCNIGGPEYYGTWLTTPNKVQLNNWHLMTFIFDDLKDSIYSYIDDKLVAQSYEPKSITYDTLPWSFGSERENGAWSWFFKGKIDDIAIWNRPLTSSEISQVFNASSCNCEDTLSNDKFVWSDGQKGRKITVKPDTTTTYVLSVADGATLHRDSIKVTVGGDSCITCIYGIKQNDTTICQGTVLELNAEIDTVSVSIPKEGLIGWWPFNGNANDESGNDNHGTLYKASLVKDRNNHSNAAYSLNGTDAYISIGNFISPPLADSSISITGWIKTDYDNSDAMNVVGARGNGPTCFAINPDNLITCTFANAGGGFHNFYSDDFIISDGKWHFFAMIYDGKTQRTYLDSMLIWKSDFQFDLLVNGLLEFGRDNPYGRYFNGIIDDIAIWNRAITQDEVRKMYELNRPKPAPSIPTNGLIGYWPFDGNAKDQTSFENHGTVKGATLTTDRCQKRNAAYEFNGIDNYIEVANSQSLSDVESITMSSWIYLDTMRQFEQGICTKWWQGIDCTRNTDAYGSILSTFGSNSGKPRALSFTNQYSGRTLFSSDTISRYAWTNIVFKHDKLKGGKIYINGKLTDSISVAGSICQSTNPLLIGADNYQGTYWRFFDGKIDDIAIWNRPLSDSEVAQVYNAGSCNCTDTLPEDKFTWSTGQKGRKITVAPNASTMYTLEVDRGKIIDRDTIHVTVLESPTPDIFGHVKVYERQINYSYYTPFNDSSTYEWSISGNGKLSSTNGGSSILVDFKEPGYAYLTVTETNKYGCKRDTTITIRIYRMTDIADSEIADERLNIYPNPMNEFGSVMVKAFIPPSTRASVSIVDMLGKNLITSELDGQNAYREIHVPISTESLINGIYMIQLRIDGNIISKKLIINR